MFYSRLNQIILKNGSVCIGNSSHWLDLNELREWANKKGYAFLTKHNDRYVKISKNQLQNAKN